LTGFFVAHAAQQSRTLVVTGHPGEIALVDMNGHPYVGLEALTRVVNGSLSFNGNQVILTLPADLPNSISSASTGTAAKRGLSSDFLNAGIEQMSVIREWRTALTSAVQRGYPVTEDWMNGYSDLAQKNLRLASVAASTESDRNVLSLLNIEFNNMKKLSNRFVDANKAMRYMAPNSLDNDPLNQSILNCGHSLASMAASGRFVNDGACQ
jgi:hypothetical protein